MVLLSCSPGEKLENDPLLVQQIQKQVKSGQPILNLSQLTEFSWDSLLILTPYSQVDSIERRLTTDLSKIKPSSIEFNDRINQLIFFNKGIPIKMIEYPRYPGDFADNKIEFIRRNDAVFDIVVTDQKSIDGNGWIELRKR